MADKKNNSDESAAPDSSAAEAAAPAAQAQQQQPGQVQVGESNASCSYANFCRVTGTPEELIIDFGLNSQPFGTPTEPIQITQRLVTNYYTAKRMLPRAAPLGPTPRTSFRCPRNRHPKTRDPPAASTGLIVS